MKYYVEIRLLPDVDIDLHFLWSKFYQQLHLAFVESAGGDGLVKVGVSFPGYGTKDGRRWLGDKLRLFAETAQILERLPLKKYLARLDDYVHIKPVKAVPEQVEGYAFFKRLNDKTQLEKLARRRAKKLSIPYAEAWAYFASQDSVKRKQPEKRVSDYPFIAMDSLSTDSKFLVTIIREMTDSLVLGDGFSTYGLSVGRSQDKKGDTLRSDSSVPLF